MMLWPIVLTLCLAEPDIVLADFEADTYGDWKATGTAFGEKPAPGTLPSQMPVTGFQGKGLVNSFFGGDQSIGKLTSPEFVINRPYLSMLVGGGGWENETCVRLLVEGKVVRSVTGPNRDGGGSEQLDPAFWDVSEFAGKKAKIEIVDQARGGWGHINVDHLVLTEAKPARAWGPQSRSFKVTEPYLLLPIQSNGRKCRLTLSSDGAPSLSLDIELAEAKPDWWAFIHAEVWKGKILTVTADRVRAGAEGVESIRLSPVPSDTPFYEESLRPLLHFSPRRGWNNDPNGLVFFRGEYHLFFQHNPVGWNWGNMHWGHAISTDLIHWKELDDALWPDAQGAMFSGSAVVDHPMTSPWSEANSPAQVLFYTAFGENGKPAVQSAAYSLDGRSFVKFSKNPVVDQITPGNRDPKVFWHEPTRSWVMALYVEQPAGTHTVQCLTSSDMVSWTKTSSIAGFFECPDIFPLPVDGDADQTKWVLTAADSDYQVGAFDGKSFHPETPKLKGHRGKGFYAAQTFNHIPSSDGRCIQVGWFQAPSPAMPFNQAMSLPLRLGLKQTPAGPRLTWEPIEEVNSLREANRIATLPKLVPGREVVLAEQGPEVYDLEVRIRPKGAQSFEVSCRGCKLLFDFANQKMSINGFVVPDLRRVPTEFRLIGDRTCLELFAEEGEVYVPMPFIPQASQKSFSLKVEGGEADLTGLWLYPLRSIWNGPSP